MFLVARLLMDTFAATGAREWSTQTIHELKRREVVALGLYNRLGTAGGLEVQR